MQTLTIIECKLEVTDDGFYSLKCGLFLLSLWRCYKFLGNSCWPYNLPCHCWRNQLLLFVHGHWFFFFNMGHGGSSWKQKILTWKALETSGTVNNEHTPGRRKLFTEEQVEKLWALVISDVLYWFRGAHQGQSHEDGCESEGRHFYRVATEQLNTSDITQYWPVTSLGSPVPVVWATCWRG